MEGSVLKLIDYGSARKVLKKGGEVGEIVGSAAFMGKVAPCVALVWVWCETSKTSLVYDHIMNEICFCIFRYSS